MESLYPTAYAAIWLLKDNDHVLAYLIQDWNLVFALPHEVKAGTVRVRRMAVHFFSPFLQCGKQAARVTRDSASTPSNYSCVPVSRLAFTRHGVLAFLTFLLIIVLDPFTPPRNHPS